MARATGLGGFFYKVADPAATRRWYREHLDVPADDYGWAFCWLDRERPGEEGFTVWSPFARDTTYFDPSAAPFMVNFRVDDLDATLARLRTAGVSVDDKIQEDGSGRFGWCLDPDGVRVELWQPPAGAPPQGPPFDLAEAYDQLRRTPDALQVTLASLANGWAGYRESEDGWSAFDIVGHLIDGEETDWMPRVRHLLEFGERRAFEPFDRERHRVRNLGRKLEDLLAEFTAFRRRNVVELSGLELGPTQLAQTGLHPDPAVGRVTLAQLLATWVAHDHTHLAQLHRLLARRYRAAVGPWRAYFRTLA